MRRLLLFVLCACASLAASEPLAYSLDGKGTALVFLHGLGGTRAVWEDLDKRLRVGHAVLRVDLPGHGDSAAPPLKEGAADLDAIALQVAGLIRKLKLAPAILVGHSLGGRVAARLAMLDPGAAQGVVLLDGFLGPLPKDWVEATAQGLPKDPAGTLRAFFGPMAASPAQTEVLVKQALKVKPDVLAAYLRAMAGSAGEPGALKCPVSLFASTFLIPDPGQEAAALQRLGLAGIPKFQVQYFVNAKHWIMMDEAAALEVLLIDFETSLMENR